MNKAILSGHVGIDPDIRTANNGTKIATFTLATNEYKKNDTGEKQEFTTWHRIVAFGKIAEVVENYLQKGQEITLLGKINNRSYQDKNGETKYVSEVVVNELKMHRSADPQPRNTTPPAQQPQPSTPPPIGPAAEEEDDLPF